MREHTKHADVIRRLRRHRTVLLDADTRTQEGAKDEMSSDSQKNDGQTPWPLCAGTLYWLQGRPSVTRQLSRAVNEQLEAGAAGQDSSGLWLVQQARFQLQQSLELPYLTFI